MFRIKFNREKEMAEVERELASDEVVEFIKPLQQVADDVLGAAARNVAHDLAKEALIRYAGLESCQEYNKEPFDMYKPSYTSYINTNLGPAIIAKLAAEIAPDVIDYIRGND